MKNILLLAIILTSLSLHAQKYQTKTGKTEFKASVEAFDPVEAINNSTTAILKAESGQIAALLFIKAFHFEIALMEEHFNENYMDSEEFPKAKFSGNINDFDLSKLGTDQQEYTMTGTLSIKGIAKKIESPIKIKMVNDKILCESSFIVKPSDFDIAIPNVVKNKLTENIKIIFDYELDKKG